jgi:hypothetical protein
MTPSNPPVLYPYISRINAAKFLCVSVQQIDKLISCGTLTAFYVGRKIILRRDELELKVKKRELPALPRPRPKGKVQP